MLRRSFARLCSPLVFQTKNPAFPNTALLTLNRPNHLNALSDCLLVALSQNLRALQEDDEVRCIVLTGSEKAFAAGADIKEMDSRKSYADCQKEDMLAYWNDISQIRKPIIAAVSGFALGGGCELAMMCDLIIASDTAVFGQPEVGLGTIPGCGGTQRLIRQVGKSKAMLWILSGEKFSAEQAERAGLVAKVVAKEKLLDESLKVAAKIARHSRPVLESAKECINRAYETSLAEGLLFERRSFHATWALKDRAEGFGAFIEKRRDVKWVDE
eukprot:GEMP01037859.1.p1 GENE.GEMP01037859.1~~GEMP01037859.1.p1  ORF type:complete len:271 (+),score=69.50 GEMP01037859.1:700-1512(+)